MIFCFDEESVLFEYKIRNGTIRRKNSTDRLIFSFMEFELKMERVSWNSHAFSTRKILWKVTVLPKSKVPFLQVTFMLFSNPSVIWTTKVSWKLFT